MKKDALQGTFLFLKTPHLSTSTRCSPGCEETGMAPVPCGCPQLRLVGAEHHGLGGQSGSRAPKRPPLTCIPACTLDALVFPRLLN